MKIAFINIYQNKVNRGAETFISEVAKRLSANHTVEIFTEVKLMDLRDFDIIVPTNGRLQAGLIRIVSWFNGSRMVVSGQSGIGLDDRINLYCFPDAFVALSSEALEWASKINPLVKSVYIPNGVDLKKFTSKKLEKSSAKVVLSVGAFTIEKRHDLTIKAVSRLNNVSLIIAGGGGDKKEEIKRMGKHILGNRFEILQADHDTMPQIYKKANVFAYPTVPWESFGIAMVEAMASGLPVVATDDPIRQEIVGNAGILVDPTNLKEYSSALKKAFETEWDDLPMNQAQKFNWDSITQKYEQLFVSLK